MKRIRICKYETGDEEYAVNGVAQINGYADIILIWSDNPDMPGTKKPLDVNLSLGE